MNKLHIKTVTVSQLLATHVRILELMCNTTTQCHQQTEYSTTKQKLLFGMSSSWSPDVSANAIFHHINSMSHFRVIF